MSLIAHARVLPVSLLALALAACSEGPAGQPGATSAATLQGAIVKGITRNALINAYAADGTLLASTLSDAQGGYALTLPAGYTGAVRLTGTPSADPATPTHTRCDASVGCGSHAGGSLLDDNLNGAVDFGEWMPVAAEFSLRAVTVAEAGVLQPVNLSLVSSMAADWAMTFPQGLDAVGVAAANQQAAAAFGLETADLEAPAGDITDPLWRNLASARQIELALVAAVPAQASGMYGIPATQAIEGIVSTFVQNHGSLLQKSGTPAPDLQLILGTARAMAEAIDLPVTTRADVLAALDARLSSLVLGAYTPTTDPTIPYLLGKLGPVGAQLDELRLLAGLDDLEGFINDQLPYFTWLLLPENVNILPLTIETIAYALVGSMMVDLPDTTGVLTLVDDGLSTITLDLDTDTLHVTGTRYSQIADLHVGLTGLRSGLQAKVLDFSVTGTLQNEVASGEIDGTLHIDLTDSDLTALNDALTLAVNGDETASQAMQDAVVALTYSLKGTADMQGSALLTRNLGPQQAFGFSVDLSGSVDLGAPPGATVATLDVASADLILPNGVHLYGLPGTPVLSLVLADDATAVVDGAATGLGIPEAIAHAEGTLVNARLLVDHVRSVATTFATSDQPTDLQGVITALLAFDATQLALHGEGTVVIPELGHHYRGRIDDLTATLYQPNSEQVAATATLDIPGQGVDMMLGSEPWRLQYLAEPVPAFELRGPQGEYTSLTSVDAMSFLSSVWFSLVGELTSVPGGGNAGGGNTGGGDGGGGGSSIPGIGVTQGELPTYVVTEGSSNVTFAFSGSLPKPINNYTVRWYLDGVYLPSMDGLLGGALPADALTAGVHSVRIELTDNTATTLTTLRFSQPIAVVPVQVTIAPDLSEFEGVSIAILQGGVDVSSAPQGATDIDIHLLGYNPAPDANHKLRWYLNGVHAPEYDDQVSAQGLVNTLNAGVYVLRLEITDLNAATLTTAQVARVFSVTTGESGGAFGWPLLALVTAFGLLRRRRR